MGTERGREKGIHLAPPLLRELGLEPGEQIGVSLGSSCFPAVVAKWPAGERAVVMGQVDDPEGERVSWGRVNLFLTPERVLRLGPLLGILFSDHKRQLREEYTFYQSVMRRAGEAGVLPFIFTLDRVNLGQEITYGFRLVHPDRGPERWEPLLAPLPDVIHNRVQYIHDEKYREIYRQFGEGAGSRQKGITLYNAGELDKGSIIDELSDFTGRVPSPAPAGVAGRSGQDTPVTLRVHLHKDEKGCWQAAAIVAQSMRRATSNRSGVGSLNYYPAAGWLEQVFTGCSQVLVVKLKESAVYYATQLDRITSQPLGEIGLDFALNGVSEIRWLDFDVCPSRVPLIQVGEVDTLAELMVRHVFFLTNVPLDRVVQANLYSF